MICPQCQSKIKADGKHYICERYHPWKSTEHIEAYQQAQESLTKYLDDIARFTTQVGQGYVASLDWQDANPEIVQSMGTNMGKAFCSVGINLPHINLCPLCAHRDDTIAIRRLNTAYCDDIENWMVSCQDCFDETVAMFDEMWDDYYSSVL